MNASLTFLEISSIICSKVKLTISDYYCHRFNGNVIVSTKSGPVKGYKTKSNLDYEYINFIGIPYAKPPIGELRFKDPQPFGPSNEIINNEFGRNGSMACQPNLMTKKPIGNENCLHLSFYTHDITPDTLKPVIVWIHGGAFVAGSNSKLSYNPEFLLRKDIVLIAINYRLGVFGFSSLEDSELGVPGNAGLKDQTMALKWIKENCMYFGGDPENITIMGVSAGGASVSLHMISNQSKGLFHKAIMLSGTAYAPWVISPVKDWTQRIAKKLGWNGEGGDKVCLDVLQRASHDALIKAQEEILTPEDIKEHIYFPFSPVVEPYESAQCFINKDPKELFSSAWSKNIPLIIGTCSEEGLLPYKIIMKDPKALPTLKLEHVLPIHEFGVSIDESRCQEVAKQLKQFYFGFSKLSAETIFTYLMVLTDKLFAHPTHRLILSRAKNESASTYLLRFNFESKYNMVKKVFVGRDVPGVCHGDDCSYYFRSILAGPDPPKNSNEWKTIERMCELVTTFAATGNPNNDKIAPVQWAPITLETSDTIENKYKCLNVSNEVSFIDWPELERMQHWDQIYKQFNRNII